MYNNISPTFNLFDVKSTIINIINITNIQYDLIEIVFSIESK